MKRLKRIGSRVLLVVFSTVLISSFSYSESPDSSACAQTTTIQAHQISGEAPSTISRSFVEFSSFDSRFCQEYVFHSIQAVQSNSIKIKFDQLESKIEHFKAPGKIYKQIRKFLI